jgi:hypothetical protein
MLQDLKYFLPYIFNLHVLLLMESRVIINGIFFLCPDTSSIRT